MKIFLPFFTPSVQKNTSVNATEPRFGLKMKCGVTADTFTPSNIHFGSTTNGTFLKHLKNVRGAYSDIVPLSGKEIEQIKKRIRVSGDARQKLNVLAPYKKNMLPVEKKVYELFVDYNKHCPRENLQGILQHCRANALNELNKEQINTFDKIANIGKDLAPDKQKALGKLLHKAKHQITLPQTDHNRFKNKSFTNSIIRLSREDDIALVRAKIATLPEKERTKAETKFNKVVSTFMNQDTTTNIKGKTPIQMLNESMAHYGIKSVVNPKFEQIIESAKMLPTSNNNVHAFVVKYANRSENEIAERLVSESLGTIEHLVADSLGGGDEAHNFVLTTKALNNERGNMPPSEFLKRHPDLPRTFQQNMDDVIREGNKGRLHDYEWYPYVVKETIREEYGFDIDISKYKIPPKKAFRTFPEHLKKEFPQFSQYFTETTVEPVTAPNIEPVKVKKKRRK